MYLISFPIMAGGTLADPIVIEDCVVSSPVKIAMIGNDIRYTSLQCYIILCLVVPALTQRGCTSIEHA